MKITNAEQYYKQVQERFPELSLKQIDQICKYGLRSFAGHNMIGGDVYLKSNYFSGYCGKLFLKQELFHMWSWGTPNLQVSDPTTGEIDGLSEW